MSRNQRLSLVAIAALIAVVAFVALRPGDDRTTTSDSRSTEAPASTTDDSTAPATTSTDEQPERRRRPKPPLLVAGSEKVLRFTKGETVRFRVRHPTPEEVHVHGYDIVKALPAGRAVTVQFPAELEGIFEVELEGTHTAVGSIRVDP